jgi:hypothetical protein
MIACVLIRQNTDATAGAQQLDYRLEAIVTIEQF